MPVNPACLAPLSASSITCCGVRLVRVISRIDCWAKIGSMPEPVRFSAAACPGVARPRRSPNPKLGFNPSVVGRFSFFMMISLSSNNSDGNENIGINLRFSGGNDQRHIFAPSLHIELDLLKLDELAAKPALAAKN